MGAPDLVAGVGVRPGAFGVSARDLAEVAAERIALVRNSFAPVPIVTDGKRPTETGWPDRARALLQPGAEVPAPAPDALNTGIECSGLRPLDLDIDDPATAEAVRALARQMLGDTIARVRDNSPRCLLPYRAAEGEPRKRVLIGTGGKIEALGTGQQFVAFGTHPSGAPLEWEPIGPDSVARDRLPTISEAQLAGFLAAAAPLIGASAPGSAPGDGAQHDAADLAPPDAGAVVALLGRLPNPADMDRDRYVSVMSGAGGCILGLRATGKLGLDDEAAIGEAAVAWAARWEGQGRGLEYEAAKWESDWSRPTAPRAGWPSLQREAAKLIPEYRAETVRAGLAGVEIVAPEPQPRAPSGLRLLTPADCAMAAPRGYIVKQLCAPRDLLIVYGQPGTGKSALLPYLGYCIARGAPAFGKRTRAGLVLYVATEDEHGLAGRVHALRIEHGNTGNFLLVQGLRDLFSPASPDRAALRDLVAERRPVLTVLDTVASSFPGLQENEAESMDCVIRYARDLAETGGGAVALAHHTPKAGTSPRGHGSLFGAADVGIHLERASDDPDAPTVARLQKNRNGPSGVAVAFQIKPVTIGRDEDGDATTAIVAVEIDPATLRPGGKLAEAEASALALLRGLASSPTTAGATLAPDGSGATAVPDAAWKEACWATPLTTKAASSAPNPNTRRTATRRAIKGLEQRGIIGQEHGLVWEITPRLCAAAAFADVFGAPAEIDA